MTRVLNIISDSNIGGAGRVLLNYARACDRENFTMSVLLPRGSDLIAPLNALGIRTVEADGIAEQSFSLAAIRGLTKAIAAEKPDIVHTHGSLSGRIAARRAGCRVVYTRHSAFPVKPYLRHGPGRWLNRWLNRRYADRIIAVSQAAAQNLYDAGVDRDRVVVMLNGVDPVARLPEEEIAARRAALKIEPEDFVCGILARIEDYKGHIDLLEAIAKLRAEGRRVVLLVAGTGSFEGAVRAKAVALGLAGDVRFLGFVGNVTEVLSLCDLQINASYGTETSSLSLLEGFSMALPAVASDYGGNPWLVTDGKNGLLFPTRDSEALARAIARLMDDRDALAAMGKEAEQIYRENFTAAAFARRIEDVYRTVLAKPEE